MLVQGLSWLTVILTGLATLVWVFILVGGNYCWSAFAFTMAASSVNAGAMLLAILPGWLRYSKTREPEDWTTLQLAGYSFLILLGETILLWILPQRGE